MKNFWQQLPKPFFVLAPMDDVTDTAFRQLVSETAAPDVFFTEFANADGYCSAGNASVMKKLKFGPKEQPLIAQVWGMSPDHYRTTAKELVKMGFAGVDINMGCPERNVVKRGACSGLINNPELAKKIIAAVKEGAGDLPVSVKTRIGLSKIVTEEWVSFLLEQKIDALTIHARTAKEMSKVPVHAEEWQKVVALRDKISPSTIIIANGDILSREQGEQIIKDYGVDGVMIGRGIFKNPFVFAPVQKEHALEEMLSLLVRHIDLYEKAWGKERDFNALKRFFKIYVSSFPGASDLRQQLMETKNYDDGRKLVRDFAINSDKELLKKALTFGVVE